MNTPCFCLDFWVSGNFPKTAWRAMHSRQVEMSKWVSTLEPTRLTTGSSRVGLRKIQLFQKWVELNPAHLTHGLNRFEPGWPT